MLSNATTATKQTAGETQALLSVFPYAILLYLGSVLWTGCGIYWSNHALQLPLVFKLNDPSLYPNDPFVSTLPYYAAPLWKAVALLNRLFRIEPLLIGLFLLERLLVLYAGARLAFAFAPGSKLAAIGGMALLALAPSPAIGNGTIVTDYFEHTGVSIAFCLLAVASFYRCRPFWTALWLAIAFHANSLYGCYGLTYIAAGFVLDPETRKWSKKWMQAALLFLLLISPTVLITINALQQSVADSDLWLRVVQFRFPHHLFPLTWSVSRYALLGFIFALIVFVTRSSRVSAPRLYRFILAWSLVCFGWLALAFAAAYLLRWPFLLVAHPIRGTDLWYAIAGIAAIVTLARKFEFRFALIASAICVAVFALGLYTAVSRPGFIKVPERDLRDVAAWVVKSTPVDALFLVNPLNGEFRALSRRPLFFSWKDGSAILWDRPFVSEWSSRLQALGFDLHHAPSQRQEGETAVESLYASLTDDRFAIFSTRYDISYAVVSADHATRYPIVYRNRSLKVLLLHRET